MIVAPNLSRLAAADKAALIYAQAQGDVSGRLWRAALGSDASTGDVREPARTTDGPSGLDALLALIIQRTTPENAPATTPTKPADSTPSGAEAEVSLMAPNLTTTVQPTGLGPNSRFGQVLAAAATRSGIPAAALAAIVDAEAAKSSDGSWKTTSRNPRSSAAGLGQFLGGTWQSEAERAGTWLHGVAQGSGWLGADGRVLAGARSTLLALRYDATASINATADYASRSLAQLKRAGVAIGGDVATVARAAYLGHHLGPGDAVRFLTNGLDSSRAKRLLDAQVGSAAASHRIARNSDAASAHRSWLLDFVNRHITPERFVEGA